MRVHPLPEGHRSPYYLWWLLAVQHLRAASGSSGCQKAQLCACSPGFDPCAGVSLSLCRTGVSPRAAATDLAVFADHQRRGLGGRHVPEAGEGTRVLGHRSRRGNSGRRGRGSCSPNGGCPECGPAFLKFRQSRDHGPCPSPPRPGAALPPAGGRGGSRHSVLL